MKKLNCIMLIDDNAQDNFFHERVIMKANVANMVISKQSGEDALEFLRNKHLHPNQHPDLIFLDINMPEMNGWEFIEEYEKLDKELQTSIIIIMLTTSDNPDDISKAQMHSLLSGFKTKPLTTEMLMSILNDLF